LFRLAAELRIKIDGLSFHVGSQAAGPAMFVEAIARCSELLRLAAPTGHTAGILDIAAAFRWTTAALHAHRGILRADSRGVSGTSATMRVIAEPGRYISAPAAISVTSVMAVRSATAVGGTTSRWPVRQLQRPGHDHATYR